MCFSMMNKFYIFYTLIFSALIFYCGTSYSEELENKKISYDFAMDDKTDYYIVLTSNEIISNNKNLIAKYEILIQQRVVNIFEDGSGKIEFIISSFNILEKGKSQKSNLTYEKFIDSKITCKIKQNGEIEKYYKINDLNKDVRDIFRKLIPNIIQRLPNKAYKIGKNWKRLFKDNISINDQEYILCNRIGYSLYYNDKIKNYDCNRVYFNGAFELFTNDEETQIGFGKNEGFFIYNNELKRIEKIEMSQTINYTINKDNDEKQEKKIENTVSITLK